jgi:hypothetical protein
MAATVIHLPMKLPPGMVSPRVPAGHCVDPWLDWMRRSGVPLTREAYIETATTGGTVGRSGAAWRGPRPTPVAVLSHF